jgi:DNA-binding NtrC family response regulator
MPKTKILIVDDESQVRDICALMLRHFGFDSIVAANGADGLQIYNERHEEICLVLSDVSMPQMGGIEMVRVLFDTHLHPNVIMMSGCNLSDLIPAEVKRLCSVIEKPFNAEQLIAAVKKCLNYEARHHPSPSNEEAAKIGSAQE